MSEKVVALVAARMSSSRFPGKVLMEIAGKPAIEHIIERLKRCNKLDDTWVITSTQEMDDQIADWAMNSRHSYYRGSLEDVLGRHLDATYETKADIIVRVPGDSPMIEPELIDISIEQFKNDSLDYFCGKITPPMARGIGCEIFTAEALKKCNDLTNEADDREHVTLYMRKHGEMFRSGVINLQNDNYNLPISLLLDEPSDLELLRRIYAELSPKGRPVFFWQVRKLFDKEREIFDINQDVIRKGNSFTANVTVSHGGQ